MRIGFLGNCQAQSLENWAHQATDVDITALPPIWLIPTEDGPRWLEKLRQCDAVFAQRLSDEFQVPELRTTTLKSELGAKVISWPNIYFDGYFPGLGYRYKTGGKFVGPLDDYHWDIIESSCRDGVSATDCAAILDGEAIFDKHPDPVTASLRSLAQREREVDVSMSDYLVTHLAGPRLFYSMNHPTNAVLLELMHRLFGLISERKRLTSLGECSFSLDKVILPVLPAIAQRYHLSAGEGELRTKGATVAFRRDGYDVLEETQWYTTQELVDCFYRCYELEPPWVV